MGYALAYDSDCGPCTAFRNAVGFLDPKRKIHFVGLQEAQRTGLLSGVRADMKGRSFHLISPEGDARSGAGALPELAALLPAGKLVSRAMSSCPPVNGAFAFGYSALSRLHGKGSCAAPRPE